MIVKLKARRITTHQVKTTSSRCHRLHTLTMSYCGLSAIVEDVVAHGMVQWLPFHYKVER